MTSEWKKNIITLFSFAVVFIPGYFIFRESFTENDEINQDKFAVILKNSVEGADSPEADITHEGTYICGDCAVLWYIIDYGKDVKDYYAIECMAENIKEYTYIREHKATEGAEGIYYADIESGCYVLIDNENCISFTGIDASGNRYERQLYGNRIPYPGYSRYASEMEFTIK